MPKKKVILQIMVMPVLFMFFIRPRRPRVWLRATCGYHLPKIWLVQVDLLVKCTLNFEALVKKLQYLNDSMLKWYCTHMFKFTPKTLKIKKVIHCRSMMGIYKVCLNLWQKRMTGWKNNTLTVSFYIALNWHPQSLTLT